MTTAEVIDVLAEHNDEVRHAYLRDAESHLELRALRETGLGWDVIPFVEDVVDRFRDRQAERYRLFVELETRCPPTIWVPA